MILRGLCWMLALCGASAMAHDARPAFLRIVATAEGQYDVLWKQPLAAGRLLPLAPVFPERCTVAAARVDAATADALLRRFRLRCAGGLRGETIAVEGLQRVIADVMLDVQLADGTRVSGLLRPATASMAIAGSAATHAFGYLRLGIDHLLFGFDHILFVLCLLFFLHRRVGALVKAVTAFTAAHSVTLGLSALQWATLPQAPVEAVIALSILFLAVEYLAIERRGRRKRSLTIEHTWLVAFAFGLLHGFGFAGALADIGLPRENLLLALLLFNIGVELGQLAVIATALAAVWALARLRVDVPRPVVLAPLWASGCLASYWFVDRTTAIVL